MERNQALVFEYDVVMSVNAGTVGKTQIFSGLLKKYFKTYCKKKKKNKHRITFFFSLVHHKKIQQAQLYFVCRASIRIYCLKQLMLGGNQRSITKLCTGAILET